VSELLERSLVSLELSDRAEMSFVLAGLDLEDIGRAVAIERDNVGANRPEAGLLLDLQLPLGQGVRQVVHDFVVDIHRILPEHHQRHTSLLHCIFVEQNQPFQLGMQAGAFSGRPPRRLQRRCAGAPRIPRTDRAGPPSAKRAPADQAPSRHT
jgi:hypothetical protein